MIDNILSFSITVLEVDLSLSICWLCIAISLDSNYGRGFAREWGIGRRFAMEPKKEKKA